MEDTALEAKIIAGLETLLVRDKHLLEVKANERSITHRLGMYYQNLFPEWDVDCEYNRQGEVPKEISLNDQDLLDLMIIYLESAVENIQAQNIVPALMEYIAFIKAVGHPTEGDLTLEARNQLKSLLDLLKKIDESPDRLLWEYFLENSLTFAPDATPIKISPDILVHQRTKSPSYPAEDNHIVFEAKKSNNKQWDAIAFDFVKLQVLTTDKRFNYDYGVFINIPVGNQMRSDTHQVIFSVCSLSKNPRIKVVNYSIEQ